METSERVNVMLAPSTRFSIKLLAILGACFALYFGRGLFLPIVLAVVLSLTLSPIIQAAEQYRIPPAISAALLIILFTSGVIFAAGSLAAPISKWMDDAPRIGYQLKTKLKSIREPLQSINDAGKQVDQMTVGDGTEDDVQEVVIKQPGLIARAADDVLSMMASSVLTLTLCYFILISRSMFYLKVVRVMPRLSDKKLALSVARDIERDVSRYLLTVSMINAVLGVCVGTSLWALGMPNPLLWGVLAAALNFLPYVGAIGGVMITAIVAVISFDSLGQALLVPATYLLFTILEGQLLTPWLLGKRFSLNTVVILLSIAFWGFMWDAVGVFVAVPLLIILKVFCDHTEGLARLGEFLSGEDQPPPTQVADTAAQ